MADLNLRLRRRALLKVAEIGYGLWTWAEGKLPPEGEPCPDCNVPVVLAEGETCPECDHRAEEQRRDMEIYGGAFNDGRAQGYAEGQRDSDARYHGG